MAIRQPLEPMHTAAERVEITRLAATLRAQGWQVTEEEADADADLSIEKEPHRLVAHVKVARDSRRILLESLLANAVLRARAASRRRPGWAPAAIVAAPTYTDTMVRALERFMEQYAPDAFAGFATPDVLILRGRDLDGFYEQTGEKRAGALPTSQPVNLFSDLNRWMLKTLLAPCLPEEVLTAPRRPIRSTSELASATGASAIAARRFLAALREQGFLEEGRAILRLVRVDDLLELWRAKSLEPHQEHRARWLLPKASDQLPRNVARVHTRYPGHIAIGLFAACDLLGLHHVSGVAPHLYVKDLTPALLEELGLGAVGVGESADVILRVAKWPKSLFRAAVPVAMPEIRGVVPATDVLQCWLDVVDHPVRGDEQADLIYRRVIKRYLLGRR